MRLVDKTVPFDSQKMFKGKYKKYDVTVYYSRNEASYEDCRFNSLWENMRYTTQEECVAACENKIDELVKQQKEKKV